MEWFLYDRDLRHERVNLTSKIFRRLYETLSTIWYHLCKRAKRAKRFVQNVKNSHGGVLLLVKLQTEASMGVFHVSFFKLYKW